MEWMASFYLIIYLYRVQANCTSTCNIQAGLQFVELTHTYCSLFFSHLSCLTKCACNLEQFQIHAVPLVGGVCSPCWDVSLSHSEFSGGDLWDWFYNHLNWWQSAKNRKLPILAFFGLLLIPKSLNFFSFLFKNQAFVLALKWYKL